MGCMVEVQVRPRDMRWHATFGDAAHAKYKVERRNHSLLRGAAAAAAGGPATGSRAGAFTLRCVFTCTSLASGLCYHGGRGF